MTQLDGQKIKKLKKGEIIGTVATVFCGVAFVYFVVLFALSWVLKEDLYGLSELLSTIMWSTAPALIAIGIGVAAFCNIKFGREIERQISKYVVQVFVENATLMHPEKDSLFFRINMCKNSVEITVNTHKEKIIFDFSAFKRLSATRQITVFKIISDTLATTFCRLFERGYSFKSVEYRQTVDSKNKTGKLIKIISDGAPDKKIMKNYYKNK